MKYFLKKNIIFNINTSKQLKKIGAKKNKSLFSGLKDG